MWRGNIWRGFICRGNIWRGDIWRGIMWRGAICRGGVTMPPLKSLCDFVDTRHTLLLPLRVSVGLEAYVSCMLCCGC